MDVPGSSSAGAWASARAWRPRCSWAWRRQWSTSLWRATPMSHGTEITGGSGRRVASPPREGLGGEVLGHRHAVASHQQVAVDRGERLVVQQRAGSFPLRWCRPRRCSHPYRRSGASISDGPPAVSPIRAARAAGCAPRSGRRRGTIPPRTRCCRSRPAPVPPGGVRQPVAPCRQPGLDVESGRVRGRSGRRRPAPPRRPRRHRPRAWRSRTAAMSRCRSASSKGSGSTSSPMPRTRARPPDAERHVGADRRGQARSSTPAQRSTGRSVGRRTAKPPTCGDALLEPDVGAPTHGRQRPAHEVVVVGPHMEAAPHADHVEAVAGRSARGCRRGRA